jgi:hypothetical protein
MGASANTAERVRFTLFRCQPLSKYDASNLSFHILRQWASYSHFINIHIQLSDNLEYFSLDFHSSSLKTTTTQFYVD